MANGGRSKSRTTGGAPSRIDILRGRARPKETGSVMGEDLSPRISNLERGLGVADIGDAVLDLAMPISGTVTEVEAAGRIPKGAGGAKKVLDEARRLVDTPREISLGKTFKSGARAGVLRGTESFGGITPQKTTSMVDDYVKAVEAGASKRDWYRDASKNILRLSGGDVTKADKMADALAITSASTPVDSNLMYSAKAMNQEAAGMPIRSGKFPTDMGNRMRKAFDQEEKGAGFGMKRSPYRAGLAIEWNGPESVTRATHDIHDVRAWGITDPQTGKPWSKGVPEAGHRVLDDLQQRAIKKANALRIAGKDDWTADRTQAAAWIAQRAKTKGGDMGSEYGDAIPRYSAQITREWPTSVPDHIPQALDEPFETRKAFSDDLETLVQGPEGQDSLVLDLGGLSDRTLPNRGFYEGQEGPGFASQVLVGQKTGSSELDEASRALLDTAAASHGILGTQKQSAYNFAGAKAPQSKAGAYVIDTGKGPMSVDELRALHAGVPDADVPMVDPRGARVLEFADEGDPARNARVKALRQYGDVTPTARDGNIFPVDENFNAPEKFSYGGYLDVIERQPEKLQEAASRALQSRAGGVLEKTEAWAAKQGWTTAPWFRPAMEALQEGGLKKLRELQKAGVVPAAFVVGVEQQAGEDSAI